ncbi:MAG: hypothetical protein DWI26_04145 [Planctomycetota bacterium]|nr:MAG: hypothetical protein DWH99_03795 [Planctomycetota bacterium]RLT16435.1 MAG: hypothetical protein DWI26_04145 [Planctomycetota bacterium]
MFSKTLSNPTTQNRPGSSSNNWPFSRQYEPVKTTGLGSFFHLAPQLHLTNQQKPYVGCKNPR